MTDDQRLALVAEARTWIGTPFLRFGASRAGVDCVGLVRLCYLKVVGVEMMPRYARRPTSRHAFAQITRFADRISHEQAVAGDVAQCVYAGESVHFGVIGGAGTIIHAAAFARRVIENSLPSDGEGRPVAFWRIRGV